MTNLEFYKNKRVMITGHTGFKGTWLCKLLLDAGADVYGYSLTPPTVPSLFELSGVENGISSHIGDIRNFDEFKKFYDEVCPEIVFHMAAQPLVLESYEKPLYTYETNVIGTANVLECIRLNPCVKSFVNITTDKVYLNRDLSVSFKEEDPLDGFDPYSNSKSCSELVTHSYKNSFLSKAGVAVSTARSGNVIGGGDFADNRIVPDCVRAASAGRTIIVRNPDSIRPYQHVLEPLMFYLELAACQYENPDISGYYNIGPDEKDCVTTGTLVETFCAIWGEGAAWEPRPVTDAPHEAGFLKLDNSKIKNAFGWRPTWGIEKAISESINLYKECVRGENVPDEMSREIKEFEAGRHYG